MCKIKIIKRYTVEFILVIWILTGVVVFIFLGISRILFTLFAGVLLSLILLIVVNKYRKKQVTNYLWAILTFLTTTFLSWIINPFSSKDTAVNTTHGDNSPIINAPEKDVNLNYDIQYFDSTNSNKNKDSVNRD